MRDFVFESTGRPDFGRSGIRLVPALWLLRLQGNYGDGRLSVDSWRRAPAAAEGLPLR